MEPTTQFTAPAPGNGGTNGHTLIHLDGVTKVFFTDEVETQALSGIYLEIRRGEYLSISGIEEKNHEAIAS